MKLTKLLAIGFLLLLSILLLEKYTNIDIYVQNALYDFNLHEWFIFEEEHQKLRYIFYNGLKWFTAIIGIASFIMFILSFKYNKLQEYRKPLLTMLLSVILVTSVISSAKFFTNVYCPKQLEIYDGDKPFIRIMDHYPNSFHQAKTGRCFPAGHATAGFALMALYFCFTKRRQKIEGLLTGLTIGWIAGLYQMLRGEHFLSHTLFTMVSSMMIIIVVDYIVNKRGQDETT